MSDNTFFVTGGTLPPYASSYVSRQADTDLYNALAQGQYCYLLNTRQMGKSSLVVRTAERLRIDIGASVAIFELSAIGQNITPDQLYYGLCNLLGQQLHLEDELDNFWFDNETLSPMQRFFESIRRVVLASVRGPLIIVVDEVDVLRSVQQHFSTDEFFGGIRDCHNRRVTQPEFQRLTFCLVGVATPSDLISDTRVSPFNIGQRIVITDFTEKEAVGLAAGLGPNGRRLLSRVLYWTSGHPHLTQRLCYQLVKQGDSQIGDVDRACQRLFLAKTARESDDNLTFVRDRLLRSGDHRVEDMLDLYARVRSGKPIYDDDSNPLIGTLRLSGVVKVADHQGRLIVRNRIYESVFDGEFIRANMPDAELRRQARAARRGRLQVGAVATAVIVALTVMLTFTVRAQNQAQEDASHARQAIAAYEQINGTMKQLHSKVNRYTAELGKVQTQLQDAHNQVLQTKELVKQTNKQAELNIALARKRLKKALEKQTTAERLADRRENEALVAEQRVTDAEQRVTDAEQKMSNAERDADTARQTALTEQKNASDAQDATAKALTAADTAKAAYDKAHQDAIAARKDADDATKEADDARKEVALLTVEANRQRQKREQLTYINRITSAQNELESGIYYSNRAVAQNVGVPQTGNLARAEELLKEARASYSQTGFEWQYLNRQCHAQERLSTVSLTDGVASIAFRPEDNSLMTANTQGTLLYAGSNRQFRFGNGRYRTVALSPQGQFFAAGDGKGNVSVWDTAHHDLVVTCRAGVTPVTALAISRIRNPRFIAGTSAGRVSVWNYAGQPVGNISLSPDVRDTIRAVALDEIGDRALIATDKETALYDVESGNQLRVLSNVQGTVSGAAFFPGGSQVALVTQDNRLHFYNADTGSLLVTQPIDASVKNPQTIAFSTQGMRAAIGGTSGVVATMQIMTPDPVQQSSSITSVAFTPDSQSLAMATRTGLFLPRSLDLDSFLLTHTRLWGSCLSFSSDGNYLAVGGRDGTVELFDKRHPGTVQSLLPAGGPAITKLVFSSDNTQLAVGYQTGKVTVWRLGDKLTQRTFQPHSSRILMLAFLPGNEQLMTGAVGDSVRVWTTDGEAVSPVPLEDNAKVETAVALSADGQKLAIAQGNTIALYDRGTGKHYANCEGHINKVACVAFSPDGNRLVSGSQDGTVRLWDVATGEQVLALRGTRYWYDGGPVSMVTFSPDGQSIGVGTEGGKATMLNAAED